MKKIMTGFWMVLALAGAQQASAGLPPMHLVSDKLVADLTQLHLDPKWDINAKSGMIAVDQASKTVTLTLDVPFNCPKFALCIQSMPAPIVIDLPLVDVSKNHCGNVTYAARQDLRPVDGALEELRVIDNTGNTCPTRVPLPATFIEYKSSFNSRLSGDSIDRLSTFNAEPLSAASQR